MASYQKYFVIGNMVADAELKQTPNGTLVCNFRVAVNEAKKSPEAIFLNCSAYGKTAEVVSKYFHKGNSILVVGAFVKNNYTDKNGIQHDTLNLNVSEISFTSNRAEADGTGVQQTAASSYATPTESQPHYTEVGDDDDLPF